MLHALASWRQLPQQLTVHDKIWLCVAFAIIILTGFFWWGTITNSWAITPQKGGIYTEGILTQDPLELDALTAKLTKIGLTYIDRKNNIVGALAESWSISEDKKTYTFHLKKGVSAKEIVDTYKGLPTWQGVEIATPNESTITMLLKQPFGLLLSFSSEPVVPAGPFIQEKQSKSELDFVANKNFILGEPNIQRIILHPYPDPRSVKAALQRQEIMGADISVDNIAGTAKHSLQLTKQMVLIFNLENEKFADKAIRQNIRDNKKLDSPLEAVLATTQDPALLAKANELKEQIEKLGIKIDLKSYNPVVLERDILPKEAYDLLLTEHNYSYDGDPYPYWHSSQIIEPGKNYAGYNNKEADKIIESARQIVDEAQRSEQYANFYKILNEDTPGILYPKQILHYTISDRLKGVQEGIGAVAADRYTEVWKWYLKAKKQPKN